jgi:hypothetical protein
LILRRTRWFSSTQRTGVHGRLNPDGDGLFLFFLQQLRQLSLLLGKETSNRLPPTLVSLGLQ